MNRDRRPICIQVGGLFRYFQRYGGYLHKLAIPDQIRIRILLQEAQHDFQDSESDDLS